MTENHDCIGCRETVWLDKAEITRIFNQKIAVKRLKLVEETTYQTRLETCRSCPGLDYGTTCRYCGCLVQVKARLAGAYCPDPNGRKW